MIGALARRELSRGELSAEIRKLAKLGFRPHGRRAGKVYGASTLEGWHGSGCGVQLAPCREAGELAAIAVDTARSRRELVLENAMLRT